MEEKKTRRIAAAMSDTKEALRAMLREACQNEHMNEQIEEKVVNELCDMANNAILAYSACRAYAWGGLGISYEIDARIDSSGITSTEPRRQSK